MDIFFLLFCIFQLQIEPRSVSLILVATHCGLHNCTFIYFENGTKRVSINCSSMGSRCLEDDV